MFARIAQNPLEDVPETGLFAGEEDAELRFDLPAERIAQFLLGAARDKESAISLSLP